VRVLLAAGASTRSAPLSHRGAEKPIGTHPPTQTVAPTATSQVHKRTLRRAHRRALHYGTAKYKGVWRGPEFFRALPTPKPFIQPQRTVRQPASKTRSPLRVLTWNPGGLGVDGLDETLHALTRRGCQIGMLQETRWRFTSAWHASPYHCYHSGGPTAGVLTFVHEDLAPRSRIDVTCLIPGRLQRVVIRQDKRRVVLINVYQHAWSDRRSDILQRRHALWQALASSISQVPQRDLLIVSGDFNTPCLQRPLTPGTHA
jgi:endonuclease/exonuclease/phosphatase (EEP) superfamily protein YafD